MVDRLGAVEGHLSVPDCDVANLKLLLTDLSVLQRTRLEASEQILAVLVRQAFDGVGGAKHREQDFSAGAFLQLDEGAAAHCPPDPCF